MHRTSSRQLLSETKRLACQACILDSYLRQTLKFSQSRPNSTRVVPERFFTAAGESPLEHATTKEHEHTTTGGHESITTKEHTLSISEKFRDAILEESSGKATKNEEEPSATMKEPVTQDPQQESIVETTGNDDSTSSPSSSKSKKSNGSKSSGSKEKSSSKNAKVKGKETEHVKSKSRRRGLTVRKVTIEFGSSAKDPVVRKIVVRTPSDTDQANDKGKVNIEEVEGEVNIEGMALEADKSTKGSAKKVGGTKPTSARRRRQALRINLLGGAASRNTKTFSGIKKVKETKDETSEKKSSEKSSEKKSSEKSSEKSATKAKSRQILFETNITQDAELTPIESEQPPVPSLAYGLDRVLFNRGVYQLQDPRTSVYNFDPYLQTIMPITEFDFDSLKQYITSSKDTSLLDMAKELGKKYIGSTSSMTSVLSHFHFLISQWRPINPQLLSKSFPDDLKTFTQLSRAPVAINLRYRDGAYAIDADKQFDTENVLTMLGKSMEKLLTLDTNEYERYRKTSEDKLSAEEVEAPEAFHYTTLGDFLMRSQLDARDPRLPGTGMFDLKTRAVVSIRMNVAEYEQLRGYEITGLYGKFESFEREYFDMIRAAFLKYSLQVRMGRMDGIFVAFHNTQRIFGFQYIPLGEMDYSIHGQKDTTLGDEEFKHSLMLLNKALDKATEKFPNQSLRLHFETRDTKTPFMYIFAEPITEQEAQNLKQEDDQAFTEFAKETLGMSDEQDSQTVAATDEKSLEDDVEAEESESSGVQVDNKVTDIGTEEETLDTIHDSPAEEESLNEATQAACEKSTESGHQLSENQEPPVEESPDTSRQASTNSDSEGVDEAIHSQTKESDTHDGPQKEVSDESGLTGAVPELDLSLQSPDDPAKFAGHSIEYGMKRAKQQKPTDDKDSISKEETVPKSGKKSTRARPDGPHKPLLAMTLTIQNKVGSQQVQRPIERTAEQAKEQSWTVDYALEEIKDPARAQQLHEMCKERMKRQLGSSRDNLDSSPYMRTLRDMSNKGAAARKAQNEASEGEVKVVYGK